MIYLFLYWLVGVVFWTRLIQRDPSNREFTLLDLLAVCVISFLWPVVVLIMLLMKMHRIVLWRRKDDC